MKDEEADSPSHLSDPRGEATGRRVSRLLALCGYGLVSSVLVQRAWALMEFAGVSAEVPLLDRAGLTLFQVQPLEPLMTLAGVGFLIASMWDGSKPRAGLWLGIALACWSIAAGFLAIAQGMRFDLVQAQFQGRAGELSSFAFTMRLATQTLIPASIALVAALRAVVQAARRP